jgi:esterase/lipase
VGEIVEQILSKNIWELERRIQEGHRDLRTRLSLLRAYALQVAEYERRLGIPPEQRAFLKVCEETQDAVLLLHGSTGSPQQLRDLALHLHESGFTVYVVRLPGHAQTPGSVDSVPWHACLTDVENRFRMLARACRNVYVVGYSFGATLALHLDIKPRPKALALIAPAIHARLRWWETLLMKVGLLRIDWFRSRLGWNGEVLEAMESARKQDWWFRLPVFALMARDDERVAASSLDFIASRAQNLARVPQDAFGGGHAILDGPGREEIHTAVTKFFKAN